MSDYVHGYVQTARGMCSDEVPYEVLDQQLAEAVERVKDVERERAFLLSRLMHARREWVGRSANALVIAAICGLDPSEHPRDSADLARCLVTRRMAPAHLHERMDVILDEWVLFADTYGQADELTHAWEAVVRAALDQGEGE